MEDPSKKHTISKTTIYINSKFFNEDNKITVPIPNSSDLILCFVLDGSPQLKDRITVDKTDILPMVRTSSEGRKDDNTPSFNMGQLDFLKLGPLFYDFVVALSPLVLVTEKLYNFFTWTDPHKTLLYSAALMIFYCFYRGLAIVFFLVFFCSSSIVITSFMKAKPLQETADTKLQIYKRNLLFIQNIMGLTVLMNSYYNRIFHDYDKTAIMNIFTTLKRFSLILALLLMMYNLNHLFIMGYWAFLFYNTSIGGALMKLCYDKV